jgi:predicted transcriptional regulator
MKLKDFFGGHHPLDIFPRVRKDDPVTSYEAADSIKQVASKHHKIIHDCLEQNGPLGKDGIALITGLESNQVARRLNEMKVIGLISLTGKTVKSNSGRNEREWTA